MELIWLDPAHLDRRDVAAAVALLEAARAVDCPHEIGPTVSSYAAYLRHGWDDPPVTALARAADGQLTGMLQVSLSRWDNAHVGQIEVTVDPLARRRGLGRRLFAAGVERTRAAGRTLVIAACHDRPSGVEFAKAMGLDRAYEEIVRRQDLRTLDWARLDHDYAVAESIASGYELVRMSGPTPVERLADVARMTDAINDAPTDDLDVEDEVFSPERIRLFETGQLAQGRRIYRLAARARDTGVFAGHTLVGVDSERPWHCWQYDTSVLRSHRGRRLGLLLKIAMLRWWAEEEPQLRTVDTSNFASNTHMIRVNEALRYHIVAHVIGWQRHL